MRRLIVGLAVFALMASGSAAAEARARHPQTVVVGVKSMRDLPALRRRYGFARMRPIWPLRAVVVHVGPGRLNALRADRRVRYVSPLGPSRTASSDPLVGSEDPTTSLPFEWQLSAAHADRALARFRGDPGVVV